MRAKTLFAVVCALNLGTGLLLGIAVDRTLLPRSLAGLGPRIGPEAVLAQLDLSAEQTTRIQALLERRTPEFRKLFEEVRPRFDALEAEVDGELGTILSAPQLRKFREIRDALKPRFDERGPHLGPGPGGK